MRQSHRFQTRWIQKTRNMIQTFLGRLNCCSKFSWQISSHGNRCEIQNTSDSPALRSLNQCKPMVPKHDICNDGRVSHHAGQMRWHPKIRFMRNAFSAKWTSNQTDALIAHDETPVFLWLKNYARPTARKLINVRNTDRISQNFKVLSHIHSL